MLTLPFLTQVYYWTTIRKNRARYSASRGIHEEEIADIIRKTVIIEKDAAKAVTQLLQLQGLRNYVQRLSTADEKEHFQRHLRKYVNMYMPDCPFEVTTTNRYTITTHEASVTARKEIKKGEEIKYLSGIQVAMTEEEEENLDLTRRDFSIVVSSRKKTRSLFLGPARFANHDCDANARLSTKGPHGMQIVSVKNIEVGEEITVSYGEGYFGDDNEECLCASCEKLQINGWTSISEKAGSEDGTPVPEEALQDGPYLFRKKRKYISESENPSRPSSPPSLDQRKRQRVNEAQTVPSPLSVESNRRLGQPGQLTSIKKERSTSSLRQEIPLSSIEDPTINVSSTATATREIRNQQRDGLLTVTLEEAEISRSTSPLSSTADGSPQSTSSTEATSVDGDTTMTGTQQITKKEVTCMVTDTTSEVSTITMVNPVITYLVDDASSDLSELSSSYELDDVLRQVVARKRSRTPPVPRTARSQSRRSETARNVTPIALDSIEPGTSTDQGRTDQRCPGDYTLTPLLLSASYSRWVACRTCEADFVQEDAYLTRSECPRCERHSKLYGYAWPKTDKEGKHDKEERILDHRTIHRFVEPEEERSIRKGKRALREQLLLKRETEERERERTMSMEVESPGRRSIKRRGRMTM